MASICIVTCYASPIVALEDVGSPMFALSSEMSFFVSWWARQMCILTAAAKTRHT